MCVATVAVFLTATVEKGVSCVGVVLGGGAVACTTQKESECANCVLAGEDALVRICSARRKKNNSKK